MVRLRSGFAGFTFPNFFRSTHPTADEEITVTQYNARTPDGDLTAETPYHAKNAQKVQVLTSLYFILFTAPEKNPQRNE